MFGTLCLAVAAHKVSSRSKCVATMRSTTTLPRLVTSILLISACLLAYPQDKIQSASPTPSLAAPVLPAQPASAVPPDSAKLEVVDAPQPDYPLEAAAKKIEGRVWIKLHILETGEVSGTEIISGEPILAQAAADAMRTWKFKPFIKNGKPVRVNYSMPFDFSLKGHFPDGCAIAQAAARMNATHHPQVPPEVANRLLIHRVEPEYPHIASTNHVQGTVLLHAVIGEDGQIRDLKAICGPPLLIPASLEAVRQWRYRPYELDGVPVPLETTVIVRFHM